MSLVIAPESYPLTTLEQIRAGLPIPISGYTEDEDARDTALIEGVSGIIASRLGRHLPALRRIEAYYIRPGRRTFRLRGYPVLVGGGVEMTLSHARTYDLAVANNPAEFGDDRFTVDPLSGVVRFVTPYPTESYAIATYTGGLVHFDEENEPQIPHWLGDCATRQVAYLKSRLGKLGGSVESVAGAGAKFEQQYGLLAYVEEILDSHRMAV